MANVFSCVYSFGEFLYCFTSLLLLLYVCFLICEMEVKIRHTHRDIIRFQGECKMCSERCLHVGSAHIVIRPGTGHSRKRERCPQPKPHHREAINDLLPGPQWILYRGVLVQWLSDKKY